LPGQACCTPRKTCGINLGPPFGCNDFSSQGGTPAPCGGGGGAGGAGGGSIDAGRGGGSLDASTPPRVDSGAPSIDSGRPPVDVSLPPFDVGGG
jgi:hypothetical protein